MREHGLGEPRRRCYSSDVCQEYGAGDGARTRDIQLGRLTLYQLSYSRSRSIVSEDGGGGRIRTFEGVRRQIYSLLPLAARAPHHTRRGSHPGGPTRGTEKLAKGLEPPTTSLQMRCSTN